jgi:hypothetical protein
LTETEKKLFVLSQIAAELNRQHITWAVGASLLLYLKDIVQEFSDIDVMVSEADAEKAKKVFLTLGKQLPVYRNTRYKTKSFSEFSVDGVDFDVIAGFTVVHNGTEFYLPLEKEAIREYAEINGESVPLQAIEEWRYIYELMGRMDKVALIDGKIPC